MYTLSSSDLVAVVHDVAELESTPAFVGDRRAGLRRFLDARSGREVGAFDDRDEGGVGRQGLVLDAVGDVLDDREGALDEAQLGAAVHLGGLRDHGVCRVDHDGLLVGDAATAVAEAHVGVVEAASKAAHAACGSAGSARHHGHREGQHVRWKREAESLWLVSTNI